MNFIYRNCLDKTVKFSLGNPPHLIHYAVSPGETVEIPEKYDYAIEAMGVKLEKDYEQSFANDQESNPGKWDSFFAVDAEHSESFASDAEHSDGYEEALLILEPKKRSIRGRKKKVTDGVQ